MCKREKKEGIARSQEGAGVCLGHSMLSGLAGKWYPRGIQKAVSLERLSGTGHAYML